MTYTRFVIILIHFSREHFEISIDGGKGGEGPEIRSSPGILSGSLLFYYCAIRFLCVEVRAMSHSEYIIIIRRRPNLKKKKIYIHL